MCVQVGSRTMGCGKSRHRSPEDSEIDLKNNSNSTNSKNNSSNKVASSQNAKKKKSSSPENKKLGDKEGDKDSTEKSSPSKKISNGKTRIKDRNEEIGHPLSSSPKNQASGAASAEGASDKTNGATKSQNKSYLLEVPNEISVSKTESQSKATCKDFKTLTASKTVHVTSSQIEFFKMLDEKIEKGEDYMTSGDTSEVSSLDGAYRH